MFFFIIENNFWLEKKGQLMWKGQDLFTHNTFYLENKFD